MDRIEFADKIAARLQPLMTSVPEGFYGSFRFTQTGNNLTHPVTLGHLSQIMWDIPKVEHVGVDLRLNFAGVKFQPDLAGLDADYQPIAFLDYESPNSSDARIPVKDVDAYVAWRPRLGESVPYVIVTTLPNQKTKDWELRYTAAGKYNEAFHGRRDAIQQNPYAFWYKFYLKEFSKRDMESIALVNIDRETVHRAYPT